MNRKRKLLIAAVIAVLAVTGITTVARAEPVAPAPAAPVSPSAPVTFYGEDWWMVPGEAPETGTKTPFVGTQVKGASSLFTMAASRRTLFPQGRKFTRLPRPSIRDKWLGPLNLRQTMGAVKAKLRSNGWHGPYKMRHLESRKSYTRWMTLDAARPAIRNRLKSFPRGDTLVILSHEHGWKYWVRVHTYNRIRNLPNATDAIDRVYTALKYHFVNWYNWGIYTGCSIIPGTYSWSQHSYGNAIDIASSSSLMYDISRWAVNHHDGLHVSNVIYNRQSWSEWAPYWHYYGGVNGHYDHVHIDGHPYLYGTPLCAW